jgi:dTDP-4-dehydrorhamnose 3,5-epimerase
MRAVSLELPGVLKIEHRLWHDERGAFLETWNEREFHKLGLTAPFVQDNMSISKRWTVRGLHYQIQQPQGKLVRVLAGEIYDVIVDLRRSSPSFGRSLGIHLSAARAESLWVPSGFAHGFLALADHTQVAYKVTDFWAPQAERTLLWDDPQLAIRWPLPADLRPIISTKDAAGTLLAHAEAYP